MKELTVEQKAKRYDEALEIINDYYQKIKYSSLSNASTDREVLEKAFPELKGSEEERIRKGLIEGFQQYDEEECWRDIEYLKIKDIIAWLEKQGKKGTNGNNGEIPFLAWGEDDEENLNWFEKFFRAESVIAEGRDIPQDRYMWFKNLKDRVQPQSKQGCCECDEIDIQTAIEICKNAVYDLIANRLKSIRPQNNITDKELAQAKKDAYNETLNKIEYHSGSPTFGDGWDAAIWYLKKRNAQPQSQWKPSDEQVSVLEFIMEDIEKDSIRYRILNSVLEQLKKLKG